MRSGETRQGRTVLIAGPTASGKSALALRIAARTDGIVINVDSMQVYSVLDRLTARPQAKALTVAPHRLYGHVDPGQRYSVGAWLEDVKKLLAEPGMEERTRIFVGGTGLYFRALLGGLSEMPAIPEEIRIELRRQLAEHGCEALHSRLEASDPESARLIRPGDAQRILRALEVLEASGEPISAWQSRRGQIVPGLQGAERYVIEADRKELAIRIERRFRQMLREGVIEEVRALLSLGLADELPAMKAIGVRELRAMDEGLLSLESAIELICSATRRYAKRQATWFRHQTGPDWKRIEMDGANWPSGHFA